MEIVMEKPPRRGRGIFWECVVALVRGFAMVAGVALVVMALLTCVDIVARLAGRGFAGAYDVVRILGVLAAAGAMPLTTAMKGHVAIEYFFDKLNPRARLVVDSLMRAVMIAALGCAVWGLCVRGEKLRVAKECTSTIQIPLFWTYWVIAAACALTMLVVLFHLVKPGKEMVGK